MLNGLWSVSALLAVKADMGDVEQRVSDSWVGDDPCSASSGWRGVYCAMRSADGSITGVQRVTEL